MIDLAEFSKLPMPVQSYGEWLGMFEFLDGFFRNRRIARPVIAELGIQSNLQKQFYESFLGARHIGIDISEKYSKPDIQGDAGQLETVIQAKQFTGVDKFDMVFIDARQSYAEVKSYFELWEPETKHIVALHPIFTTPAHPDGARKLWQELIEMRQQDFNFVTFYSWIPPEAGLLHRYQMGTGLLCKKWI